jgi:hypothetical protein
MISTYTFTPTTTIQEFNGIIVSKGSSVSLSAKRKLGESIIGITTTLLDAWNNSFLKSHNDSMSEPVSLVHLTTTVCEETNMNKERNLFRLDQIAKLKNDWNGYGAKSFSQELIEKCKVIISSLDNQPQIFPTGRQSIQLQYELADRSYLEFEIFEEKVSCLEVPKRRYSDARTFEFPISETQRIKEIVKEFYGQDGSSAE